MSLTKRQLNKLHKIIDMAQEVIASSAKESAAAARVLSGKGGRSGKVRRRRSSADAQKMRADILAKRAKGVSAASLAEKYGVSTAYIYMMK
jgi:hypothetical protein